MRLEISVTALRIFLIFGQKLEGDRLGTVTEPDFPKKFWIIQKSRKHVLLILQFWMDLLKILSHPPKIIGFKAKV